MNLSRCEATRCRDIEVSWASSMVATRARWRVASNSSNTLVELDKDECEGAGEMGSTGDRGTKTGKVEVGG